MSSYNKKIMGGYLAFSTIVVTIFFIVLFAGCGSDKKPVQHGPTQEQIATENISHAIKAVCDERGPRTVTPISDRTGESITTGEYNGELVATVGFVVVCIDGNTALVPFKDRIKSER